MYVRWLQPSIPSITKALSPLSFSLCNKVLCNTAIQSSEASLALCPPHLHFKALALCPPHLHYKALRPL